MFKLIFVFKVKKEKKGIGRKRGGRRSGRREGGRKGVLDILGICYTCKL